MNLLIPRNNVLYDWYQHIYFSQPAFFGLLALVPLLIWWEIKRSGRAQATVMVSTVRAFRGTACALHLPGPRPLLPGCSPCTAAKQK